MTVSSNATKRKVTASCVRGRESSWHDRDICNRRLVTRDDVPPIVVVVGDTLCCPADRGPVACRRVPQSPPSRQTGNRDCPLPTPTSSGKCRYCWPRLGTCIRSHPDTTANQNKRIGNETDRSIILGRGNPISGPFTNNNMIPLCWDPVGIAGRHPPGRLRHDIRSRKTSSTASSGSTSADRRPSRPVHTRKRRSYLMEISTAAAAASPQFIMNLASLSFINGDWYLIPAAHKTDRWWWLLMAVVHSR